MASFDNSSLFSVQGKTALVSGGGTGIGAFIAQGLARNGAKVYIVGRRRDKLDQAVKQFDCGTAGGELIALPGDVSNKSSVAELVRNFKQHESRLDILVNAAGIIRADPVSAHPEDLDNFLDSMWSATDQSWSDSFSMNVSSLYFMSVGFAPLLHATFKANPSTDLNPHETPHIVNIGSLAATHIARDAAPVSYQASKSAVVHLTHVLAARFMPYRIRVNAINPGLFPSEMTQTDPTVLRTTHKTHFKAMPEGRAGTPEDIAGPVIFLSSRAGAYLNGNVLDVAGGRSLMLSAAILPEPPHRA
ncbi:hypothetical protein OIO90_000977 [Microbotryomycetes sp. JL221]|nr:hypothetical protein OIO90_000977 [Microbotryomycetes sp. JL221]